jgi:hypothetical protein
MMNLKERTEIKRACIKEAIRLIKISLEMPDVVDLHEALDELFNEAYDCGHETGYELAAKAAAKGE